MEPLRPVLDQIARLWSRIKLMPVIRWGTVTQASPLRVQLDGDADPLALTPMSIVGGLGVNERVLCVEQHLRIVILGRGRGSSSPYAVAMGTFGMPAAVEAGGFIDLSITFPSGRFTVAPIVLAQSASVRLTARAQEGVTSAGATIRVFNALSVDVAAGTPLRWEAKQMTSGSASG